MTKNRKPIENYIAAEKRAIREYYHRQDRAAAEQRRVIYSKTIDGYIELIRLPSFIRDRESADEYFQENEYFPIVYSAYDCTGRLFTCWYKIFRRPDGSFWAYHSVGRDV